MQGCSMQRALRSRRSRHRRRDVPPRRSGASSSTTRRSASCRTSRTARRSSAGSARSSTPRVRLTSRCSTSGTSRCRRPTSASAALRTAMAWQRTDRADAVVTRRSRRTPRTPRSSTSSPPWPASRCSTSSACPPSSARRSRPRCATGGITTLVLVGAVLEIGIEPTARHAADLGFLPVVVDDACGIVEPDAAQRSLDSLGLLAAVLPRHRRRGGRGLRLSRAGAAQGSQPTRPRSAA